MDETLYAPGHPLVQRVYLWDMLTALDDPTHLEFPVDFNEAMARTEFQNLVQALEEKFVCRCVVDGDIEDASFLGSIEVPASATESGVSLVLRISNFGRLIVCAPEAFGSFTDDEADGLVQGRDASRIRGILRDIEYRLVPEEPLRKVYDGHSRLRSHYPPRCPPSWFIRFFDYL